MVNNEVRDSLKSDLREKIEALETKKAEGAAVIAELKSAEESGDAGRVSEVSEKFDAIGAAIKSAQSEVERVEEMLGWMKEYQMQDDEPVETNKGEFKNLMDELKSKDLRAAKGKTVGEIFADLLKYRGLTRGDIIKERKAETVLRAYFGDRATIEDTETAAYKNVKSIYSNHGEVFVDNANPVPGFMGAQCGLVEDPAIHCLLDPPADDFESCITQLTLNGNRVRYTYEAARDNNAAAVYETIYNPYPEFARDGTKPESTFTLASATVNDSKIADFIVASDEVLEDCPQVADMINHVLISNVNEEKRRQLILGTGNNGEMRGILAQPNLLERTHQDVADGGDAEDNIYDTFRRGLTDIWLQNGSTDNVCAILHPRDLEAIDLAKDNFGQYLFNDTQCFNRMLRCLTLRTSVHMPQGTAVVGNFANNWVFYLRKALDIKIGLTGDQFITNTSTILAELRGLNLVRCPNKIVKIEGLSGDVSSS